MFAKNDILILLLVSTFSDAAFVDKLEKCSTISDGECQKKLLQFTLKDISKTGIPEYGIPPLDPFKINDLTVSIFNLVDITMIDGVAKGMKDCVVNNVETKIEKRRTFVDLTCDFTIKGTYRANASGPIVMGLLGGNSVHGEGSAKVVIDKIKLKLNYGFVIEKKDGDTFIKCQTEDLKYDYAVDKITFTANNIYLGDSDISDIVVKMLNENWKSVLSTVGKPFLDKVVGIVYQEYHKFFDVVPTKYYFLEDLSSYISTDKK